MTLFAAYQLVTPKIDANGYAGNRTEEFVEQAIAQVEKFTNDPTVTNLLLEINESARLNKE